jgi:hypothetical protein
MILGFNSTCLSRLSVICLVVIENNRLLIAKRHRLFLTIVLNMMRCARHTRLIQTVG